MVKVEQRQQSRREIGWNKRNEELEDSGLRIGPFKEDTMELIDILAASLLWSLTAEFALTRPVSSGKHTFGHTSRTTCLTLTALLFMNFDFSSPSLFIRNVSLDRLESPSHRNLPHASICAIDPPYPNSRYGLNICRQCFREKSAAIGFVKVRLLFVFGGIFVHEDRDGKGSSWKRGSMTRGITKLGHRQRS
jgi:hypothetical protein